MDFQRQNSTLKQLLAGRITRIDTLSKKQDNYVFPRTHHSSKPSDSQVQNSNFRKQSQDSISISNISQVYNLNDQNTPINLFQPNYSHNNRLKEDPKIVQEELHFEQLCQIRLEPLLKNWSQQNNDQKLNGIEGWDNPEKKSKRVEKSIKIKLCSVKPHQPKNPTNFANLYHFNNTASSPVLQLQDLSQENAEGCFDNLKSGLWNLFDNPKTETYNQSISKNNQLQLFSERKKQIVKHRKIKSIFNNQLSTSELKHHRSISTNINPTINNSQWIAKVQPNIGTKNYRSKSAFCQKRFSMDKPSTRKIKILEFQY